MEINQEKFIETPKAPVAKAKSKKSNSNSKNLIMLFVLIVITVGVILFLINLMQEPQQEPIALSNKTEVVAEVEEPKENLIPPKPTADNTIFDSSAIEAKKNEPTVVEEVKEPIVEYTAVEELKDIEIPTVDNPVTQVKEVVVTSSLNVNTEPIVANPLNKNKTFENLKKEAVIKTNFFNFRGKNYYEGDTINDVKIKEVTTETIKVEFDNKLKEISK